MIPGPVHYVPLDCIVAQPPRVLAVCGTWCDGLHWSTATAVVTCRTCIAFLAVSARLGHDAVVTPEASLVDAARGG